MPSIIIMKDGKVCDCELNETDKSVLWHESEMKKVCVNYEDIFIAEFWSGHLTFILNDGEVKKLR